MTKDELTKDDMEAVSKDIEKATKAIADSNLEKAKEEGRREAVKELELKRQLDEQEQRAKDLEAKLSAAKAESEAQLKKVQEQLDSMASSKQVVASQNPFKDEKGASPVDSWSEDKVKSVEEASARAFFGHSYDDR